MNNKDAVGEGITTGVILLLGGPAIAFAVAAVFGLVLGAAFTPVFYASWAVDSIIGIVAIIGGIAHAIERRKHITSFEI